MSERSRSPRLILVLFLTALAVLVGSPSRDCQAGPAADLAKRIGWQQLLTYEDVTLPQSEIDAFWEYADRIGPEKWLTNKVNQLEWEFAAMQASGTCDLDRIKVMIDLMVFIQKEVDWFGLGGPNISMYGLFDGILDPEISYVRVTPESVALEVGEKEQLTAEFVLAGNDACESELRWISSDTSVAEVSASGEVTAKSPGTAWINAFVPDFYPKDLLLSNSVEVKVEKRKVRADIAFVFQTDNTTSYWFSDFAGLYDDPGIVDQPEVLTASLDGALDDWRVSLTTYSHLPVWPYHDEGSLSCWSDEIAPYDTLTDYRATMPMTGESSTFEATLGDLRMMYRCLTNSSGDYSSSVYTAILRTVEEVDWREDDRVFRAVVVLVSLPPCDARTGSDVDPSTGKSPTDVIQALKAAGVHPFVINGSSPAGPSGTAIDRVFSGIVAEADGQLYGLWDAWPPLVGFPQVLSDVAAAAAAH